MMQRYTFFLIVFLGFLSGCGEFSASEKLKNAEDIVIAENSPKDVNMASGNFVEAPDVFKISDAALWDGRPTFGGIWVAHPDVIQPESVLIRNSVNGESVRGALFRRERLAPGPSIQVSADAAAALGLLAGAPVKLDIVAISDR